MKKNYQGIARTFRPRTFQEVVGQEVIVTTLKNALKFNRLAHAYLFCGSRGTGKTTLARIFAKAINCSSPAAFEPCNQCSSCLEIAAGGSLDVLEIDGASNRSIDDIRNINETVAYATASGKTKIYIIDEVHMLTKEAFNALLKTLEEPPANVKFFFATTEPNKVLPTILSRCQRFNLRRIPTEAILTKLEQIAKQLERAINQEALRTIALRAEGSLRDAESLLDQIFAFHEGEISESDVLSALGIVPKDLFFTLDREGKTGNLAAAFALTNQIYAQGKDLHLFVEGLLEHFRNISLVKLSGKTAPFLDFTDEEREKYAASANIYSQEQLLAILDVCLEAHQQMRHTPLLRIALEALLLRIMRTHRKIPLEQLVERLNEIEKKLQNAPESINAPTTAHISEDPTPIERKMQSAPSLIQVPTPVHISEDPTPTASDLKGIVPEIQERAASPLEKRKQAQYDTILQFAAIELEGRIQKK